MLRGKQGGAMPYRISAISPEGLVSFRSKTPAEALQTAVELMGFGLKEICITDAGGARYTHTDFGAIHSHRLCTSLHRTDSPSPDGKKKSFEVMTDERVLHGANASRWQPLIFPVFSWQPAKTTD
jgi:hypothetical protein